MQDLYNIIVQFMVLHYKFINIATRLDVLALREKHYTGTQRSEVRKLPCRSKTFHNIPSEYFLTMWPCYHKHY